MAEAAPSGPDRLPWLTEVPRIGPPPPAPRKRWEFPWGAVLIGLAFAFVAVAAYYLGIRRAVAPEPSAETRSMPLDQPYEQSLSEPAATPEEEEDVADAAHSAVPSTASDPVARPTAVRPRQSPERRSRSAAKTAQAAPEQVQPPAPVILQPVVRGRIIQLGAYPNQAQAELAWQALVKKWPYLATKPRLVSPIDVRSTDGKATRMHRLQLATASQAQSVVICQQLAKTKQNCVVVY